MSTRFSRKGRIGVHLVLIELLKRGIETLVTPYFWPFDLITNLGLRLEVKYSNIGKGINARGDMYDRFAFNISFTELKIVDFVVLVLNTQKDHLFYIIPKDEITSKSIAFNPFSTQTSKYEKYLNKWELIINLHDKIVQKRDVKTAFFKTLSKIQTYH